MMPCHSIDANRAFIYARRYGGKWMEHEPESDIAQKYAHSLAQNKATRGQLAANMVLSPGDYQVKKVMTKVWASE